VVEVTPQAVFTLSREVGIVTQLAKLVLSREVETETQQAHF
jgi:hypothetical protein